MKIKKRPLIIPKNGYCRHRATGEFFRFTDDGNNITVSSANENYLVGHMDVYEFLEVYSI